MDKQTLINEYAEKLGTASANLYFESLTDINYMANQYSVSVEKFKESFIQADIGRAHVTLGKIVEAIEAKNVQALKDRLWYDNKISRKFFTAYTGVELGKTDKSMRLAIDQWAAQGVLV